MHVVGEAEPFGNHGRRVMIPGNQVDRNSDRVETDHLIAKKQTGAVVLPITIVEITGDDQKIHALVDCKLYQVLECSTGRASKNVSRRAFM